MQQDRTRRMRIGWIVAIGLTVLTVIEYFIAIRLTAGVVPLLAVIALVKAGLIVYYFMHVYHLWHEEVGH